MPGHSSLAEAPSVIRGGVIGGGDREGDPGISSEDPMAPTHPLSWSQRTAYHNKLLGVKHSFFKQEMSPKRGRYGDGVKEDNRDTTSWAGKQESQ